MIKTLRTGMGSKSTGMRVAQGQRVLLAGAPPQDSDTLRARKAKEGEGGGWLSYMKSGSFP